MPLFDASTDSHFFYLYDFLTQASNQADIFLIIEKSKDGKKPIGAFSRVYLQKFSFAPIRFVELKIAIFWARLAGFKHFYTHYSYYGAILTGLISRLTGGWSYYWNCGMPWLYGSQLMLKLSIKCSHYLITGNKTIAKGYMSNYGVSENKIKLMANWIDTERFSCPVEKTNLRDELKLPKDKQIILFAHWLSERKGADLIIPIVEKLDAKLFVVLVAGSGPLEQKIKQEIMDKNLDGKIMMLGGISQSMIAKYFCVADIFLMPSREEGMPHVLLEAMASGLPFIASDIGGVSEMVPFTAKKYLSYGVDAHDLAHKIELLSANRGDYQKFVKEAKEMAQTFSQNKAIDTFIKLFND